MNHDSNWYKQREEFNNLVNLWDKAQADGIFPAAENTSSNNSENFFGQQHINDTEISNSDVDYWSDVVSRSGEMFPDESMFLMEAARKKATEKKKKKVKENKVDSKAKKLPPSESSKSLNDMVKTSLETNKETNKKEKAKTLGNNANPIYPDTTGPDNVDPNGRVRVTAGLAAHPDLEKLEDLKKKLYDLEVQMNDQNGLKKNVSPMEKKFRAIMKEIEKLSDRMTGKFADSEYYN